MATNLRQSVAEIKVEGIVSEKSLEKKYKDGKESIQGSITVKTAPENFVRINVFCSRYKSNGEENKTYDGINTVMNEYKSIAEFGEENADKVYVKGDINPFTNKNGGVSVGYRSNFFTRLTRDMDPRAEFNVELFVTSVRPEANEEGDTGRVVIEGWMPTYNGIEKITLIANEDLADDVMDYCEPKNTYNFFGDIIAIQKKEKKIIKMGIGKDREEVSTFFVNEMVISGVSEPYEEGVSAELPYDEAAINLAIQERDDKLKEQKEGKSFASSKPSGAAMGRSLSFDI